MDQQVIEAAAEKWAGGVGSISINKYSKTILKRTKTKNQNQTTIHISHLDIFS